MGGSQPSGGAVRRRASGWRGLSRSHRLRRHNCRGEAKHVISFEDKVALVVGGTSGIGQATAEGFGRLRAKVVVAGRRADRGEQGGRRIVAAGGGTPHTPPARCPEGQGEARRGRTA